VTEREPPIFLHNMRPELIVDQDSARGAELARVFAQGPVYFGEPWGPSVDAPERLVATPTGHRCIECDELVADGDRGIVMLQVVAVAEPGADESDAIAKPVCMHRECFLFNVLGTPACHDGTCECHTQPFATSHRQTARNALAHWEAKREGRPL